MNNFKKSDRWKIQLTIAINFFSSKNNDEEPVMHSKSDNTEIMIKDKTNEVIKKLFDLLLNKYQIGLETLMRGSDFIYDCVHLLHSRCHKVNFKRGRSYIDSSEWIKEKKATINPISKKDSNRKKQVIF